MALPFVPAPRAGEVDAVIFGMPFDGIATLRGGETRAAPGAVRRMSMLYGGYNLDWDFDVFQYLRAADRGDVDIVPGNTPASYERLERWAGEIVAAGAVPMMIGGDHGVTYPAVKAVVEHHKRMTGLVVFDTHLDLSESFRNDRLTRASPLKRICELEWIDPRRIAVIGAKGPRNPPEWMPLARELGIRVYTIGEVDVRGIRAVAEEALSIAMPGDVPPYLSIDIDSVDASAAPGTNSIEVGGLTSRELLTGIRIVAERGLSGFDVVEVAPTWDTVSRTTATLAARAIAEALAALAAPAAGRRRAWDFSYKGS
jgi:agmatinase